MTEQRTQANGKMKQNDFWSPRFLMLFAITLVFGLSAESLLTEAWQNNGYQVELILSGHIVTLLIAFIALMRITHSLWIRASAFFGLLWGLFSLMSHFLPTTGTGSTVGIDVNAAASSALLCLSICLSTHRTPHTRWDNILFWLLPLLAGCILCVYVIFHPIHNGHVRLLVETATTVLLAVVCVLWWARPSCWHTQPCQTFLFGLASLLSLFVHYWVGDALGTQLFLSQIALLCILLATLCVIRAEQQADQHIFKDTLMAYTLANNTPHDEQNQYSSDGVVEQMQQHARPE